MCAILHIALQISCIILLMKCDLLIHWECLSIASWMDVTIQVFPQMNLNF